MNEVHIMARADSEKMELFEPRSFRREGLRAAVDPRAALLSFFESAYCGGSDLADWNREELASSWRPEPATLRDLLGGLMDDSQIHGSIENLVAEEHELWNRESNGTASDDDRRRLEQIRVSLDQCWDLLRQRRARRDAGQDPDTAVARDTNVVERYEQ